MPFNPPESRAPHRDRSARVARRESASSFIGRGRILPVAVVEDMERIEDL
jgi:hypothetical protein